MHSLTIQAYQQMVDDWVKAYGVRYFSTLTNLALLMEEVGELARVMARLHGDQSFKRKAQPADAADEMADILFVLTCLANQTGVDLNEALLRNLEKKTARDRSRHINNPKLAPPEPPAGSRKTQSKRKS